GRLTDSQGRTVDFRNAVIVMTSNIGSHYILERSGADWAETETHVMSALRQHFRPEFLNRVDDVIVFRPLGAAELDSIIDLQLDRLHKLLSDRKLTLELTPDAKKLVAAEGFDPAYGARPLKRSIQRMLQDPLAMAVLEGRFAAGDHILATVGEGGKISFEKSA
ncbi:MAG: AAA family ATPase, partial [Gemmatimonadaceae bacterium]